MSHRHFPSPFLRPACFAVLSALYGCASTPSVSSDGAATDEASNVESTTGDDIVFDEPEPSTGDEETAEAPQACGNGQFEAGEVCDDGNTRDGDGCSKDCSQVDARFLCGAAGEACEQVAFCGNGMLEGNEVCDDGNTEGADGCSGDCSEAEEGFLCIKPGESCMLVPICGNGIRERGESCDDGEAKPSSGDGCSSNCEQEEGYFCPPGRACEPMDCGDGNRTPDEECDLGADTGNGLGCDSACKVEAGWRCASSGCSPICGDGEVFGSEECDDGGRVSGDGCSAACREEWDHDCSSGTCVPRYGCGNGSVDPGEVCDASEGSPDQVACSSNCLGFVPEDVEPTSCDGVEIEPGEECDGGEGCNDCVLDPDFACPKAGECFRIPVCGDGYIGGEEECDMGPGNVNPGCLDCQIQPRYICIQDADEPEKSSCTLSVCGDGTRDANEQCDDGNDEDGDGCSGPVEDDPLTSGDESEQSCNVETGWICPPGDDCRPDCGDGFVEAPEQCDDGNQTPNDGCTSCRIDPGYDCDDTEPNNVCSPSTCGNGTLEYGESCDLGDTVAGDGCGPTCQLEPMVTVGPSPVVATTCGDGLKTSLEECDDGNRDDGDGCTQKCEIEDGWYCSEELELPPYVDFQVRYRDFKGRGNEWNNDTTFEEEGYHTDFGWQNGWKTHVVGAPCDTSNSGSCGRLDAQGKPQFQLTDGDSIENSDTFELWYRDWASSPDSEAANGASVTNGAGDLIDTCYVDEPIRLVQQGGTSSDRYQFNDNAFNPLGSRCFGSTAGNGTNNKNWHFTTELRYFFQYKGGETLTFYGDDDVWVFVNGRLAVDIGGVHSQLYGRVVLGDDGDGSATENSCSVHVSDQESTDPGDCELEAGEASPANLDDKRFDLEVGGVYEIVLFQAERYCCGSNFQLTMEGFLAPRSSCNTHCGDEIRAGAELCDEGDSGAAPFANPDASDINQDGVYGACNKNCTLSFCGDGTIDTGAGSAETCDDGVNAAVYDADYDLSQSGNARGDCGVSCQAPAFCGDGIIQREFGEQCDLGTDDNDGSYGGCNADCTFADYCGDGYDNPSTDDEGCDPGVGGFVSYDEDGTANGLGCAADCQPAPYCGDDIRNGVENCDDTSDPNCVDCFYAPYCGDGFLAGDRSEQCDNGTFNANSLASASYGSCVNDGSDNVCVPGPHCGDGLTQSIGGEQCDEGANNDDSAYGNSAESAACTTDCLLGPHCGDGIQQAGFLEACDNGFNEDVYEYPPGKNGESGACGFLCSAVPFCGDGVVDSLFEFCDNGDGNDDDAYDGCTTRCEYGPYCGDGKVNGTESCDDGADNVAYSATPGGCSFDCDTDVPHCGDGVRNGPEECDDGTEANDGSYGGCNADCTRAPRCGDGQLHETELCDDGPSGSESCTQDCMLRVVVK